MIVVSDFNRHTNYWLPRAWSGKLGSAPPKQIPCKLVYGFHYAILFSGKGGFNQLSKMGDGNHAFMPAINEKRNPKDGLRDGRMGGRKATMGQPP